MHTRAIRFVLVAVLVASAIGAAILAWQAERRVQSLEAERRGVELRLERIAAAALRIAAGQQAYVDYGQRDEASFARVAALLDQITTDAAGLHPSEEAPDAASHLDTFWMALAALADTHAEAREMLAGGEGLVAADLLFGSARPHVETIATSLRAFRDAELNAYSRQRMAITQRAWLTIGAVAVPWLIGLLALVRVPAARAEMAAAPHAEPASVPEHHTATPTVDLATTAALCEEIARLDDTAALPDILSRAATLLDARGLIVWMGAGDELFAAAAGGYDPSVVHRLRPIGRAAENATAAAWRTGDVRTVAADETSLGAIVAPMPSASGCIGVLAAEVRHGREHDLSTKAATAILASHLAMAVSAWPAASSGADAAPDAAGTAPEAASDSDRQAAAS